MTFPTTPLDLRCELDLGGTQTDVSSYVYQRQGDSPPVTLTRGRADESGQANPGSGTWEWNNRDGRFSPKNPVSPYYGQLIRNTPVRWSVPAQVNYLRLEADQLSRASCPDAAGLHITGDIDIRLDVKLTSWPPGGAVLAAKWGTSGSFGWIVSLTAAGTVQFFWSTTGSDFPSATRPCCRCRSPGGRLSPRHPRGLDRHRHVLPDRPGRGGRTAARGRNSGPPWCSARRPSSRPRRRSALATTPCKRLV